MYSAPRGSSGNFLKRNAAPLTTALILCNVAALLLEYGLPAIFERPFALLTFTTTSVVAQPWTLVTYPLLFGGGLLCGLLTLLIMWWFGASLERSWGTRWFAAFFFGLSAAFALSIWVGGLLLGHSYLLRGVWVPAFGVFTAWALLNPNLVVSVWGILPVRALYLAYAEAVLLWLAIGDPVLGLFAQGGNLAAWGFVAWRPWNRFVGYRTPPRRTRPAFREREAPAAWNPLAQWEERKRRQKIDALFRNSGYDDRDDPPVLH